MLVVQRWIVASLRNSTFTSLDQLGDDPRRYEAALRVLLSYAGEQLTLVAGAIGLSASVSTELAERILSLPLFDTGAATLVSAHRMIEQFRRYFEQRYAVGDDIPAFDWASALAGTPALVRGWLDAQLQAARVVMPASASGRVAKRGDAGNQRRPWDPARAMPLDVLAWNVEHWLSELRRDPRVLGGRTLRATRVWVSPHELGSGSLIEGGDMRVDIYGEHPLVLRVREAPTAVNLAWLMFAVYAHLNAVTGLITNAHELQFQLIVGDALEQGRLVPIEPASGDLFEGAR